MTTYREAGLETQAGGVWQPPPRRNKGWFWALGGLLALVLLGLLIGLGARTEGNGPIGENAGGPYVGVLYVQDTMTISQSGSGLLSGNEGGYHHQYLLDAIEEMMQDPWNQGLLLYIDSPGGEVLAADELSRKVEEYKAATGRPVFAYGYTYTASGGYWLACTADTIYLNRYCLTGSIGVTMGSLLDISGLLEKYGVAVYDLASGDQKNGGNGLTPMDPETIAIYQGILDEYYRDFLDWVLAHRPHLTEEQLLTLADGRVYTARQAVENGLADQVGDYGAALRDLQAACGGIPSVREYYPDPVQVTFLDLFTLSQGERELSALLELARPQGILAYYQLGQ